MTRHSFSIAALGLVFVTAGCSTTGDGGDAASRQATTTAEQQVTLADDDPQKIRCKRYESTGSRISNKVCKTNAEWEAAARSGREAAENVQRESVQTPGLRGG